MISGLVGIYQGGQIAAAGSEAQAQTIIQSGEISAQGATLTAAGYRQSAAAVQQASIFNEKINEINESRKLSAMSRQYQRTIGAQLRGQASSGLSVTGKSFLLVQSETANVFEKMMLDFKIDAENARRAQKFETDVRMVTLENQARAAEYQAAASRVMAANKAAEARYAGEVAQFKANQQVLGEMPTLLGQVFSGSSSSSTVNIPKDIMIS